MTGEIVVRVGKSTKSVVNINHVKQFKRFLVHANGSKYYLYCFHNLNLYVKVPLQPSSGCEEGWRDEDFVKFDQKVIERMLNNPNFKLIPC